jgi:hypothetical protein
VCRRKIVRPSACAVSKLVSAQFHLYVRGPIKEETLDSARDEGGEAAGRPFRMLRTEPFEEKRCKLRTFWANRTPGHLQKGGIQDSPDRLAELQLDMLNTPSQKPEDAGRNPAPHAQTNPHSR